MQTKKRKKHFFCANIHRTNKMNLADGIGAHFLQFRPTAIFTLVPLNSNNNNNKNVVKHGTY